MIGNAKAVEEMLGPKVEIKSIAGETSQSKVTTLAFELYKETIRVLNLAAHILDQAASANGGLPRNQAICAGLLIRMVKFMIAVLQLTCKDDRGEVVLSLTRSIMESAFDLEFLVRANDDKHFSDFVEHSLGAERELYDLIQTNIAKRSDGSALPIEKRMLRSIDRLCEISGVKTCTRSGVAGQAVSSSVSNSYRRKSSMFLCIGCLPTPSMELGVIYTGSI